MEVMRPAIRLLAIDIDGTLLDTHSQLPPRNVSALEAAHRAGVEVLLVTGRRFAFALPVAQLLPFELVMITSNGALVKSRSGQSYYRDLLARETAAQALEWTRRWRDYTLLAYDVDGPGQLVLERLEKRTPTFLAWLERNRQFVSFAPLEETLQARAPEEPLQVMYSGPVEVLRQIESRLLDSPFRAEFRLLKTEYVTKDLSILDVINRRCSKGHAVRTWAQRQGCSREEVMAIGDNFNDREMLEFAGRPVVMDNAVAELKSNGWQVTANCNQAGVADAVERWILA
jgi:Cof subfamily protein (haloacid dehalogenase superfamily)